ncbi:hypothetical protein EDD22DRAFT_1007277 [Suillus occidentalis]|nr:hypothetical protein EDD22DRAFT_1007277 [Suillus occidentalis]
MSNDWQILRIDNGDHDFTGIDDAIVAAHTKRNNHTFIYLQSTIGYGSKQQGIYSVHGSRAVNTYQSALRRAKPKELASRIRITLVEALPNVLPSFSKELIAYTESQWNSLLAEYVEHIPRSKQSSLADSGKLLEGWEKPSPDPVQAFRKLSELVFMAITSALPNCMCGSANLTGSDITKVNVDLKAPSTGLGCSLHCLSVQCTIITLRYEFGFGLSCTIFEYSDLAITQIHPADYV